MDIDELIKKNDRLATLPDVYYRLNETIHDPDCTFDDIGEIICTDTALTARLLRIVNSAYYGFSNRVETVTHALSIIGTDQLSQLVLASSVLSRFSGIPQEIYNMESFWRHSLGCGLAARALASLSGESNVERFFVAGLLHDIGRLVMCIKLPDQVREVLKRARETGHPLHKEEKKMFGYDHAEVGGKLVKSWLLPERLEESIRFHHSSDKTINYPVEAATVDLANGIAHSMQLGDSGEVAVLPLNQKAWKTLSLPENLYLPMVKEKIEEQFEEVTRVFLQKQ
jgi:putative nucleotidyltransferase with HDIG domain